MDAFAPLLAKLSLLESSTNAQPCQQVGCHHRGGNLKTCSRCGVAAYCSKLCQTNHWKTHKKLCTMLAPRKQYAKDLDPPLKTLLLNSMTFFDLPPIAEEYERRYKIHPVESLHVRFGLQCTQKLIESNIENLFKDDYSRESLLKRWHEVSPELYGFLKRAQPGDVFRTKQYHPYRQHAPQQFRNTPLAERGVIRNGDRVIDIGFVDFGMIFDSTCQIQEGGERVVVTGVEGNPFNVAKSLVMMQMIQQPDTSPRSVVEVWMSSLWSKATFTVFKEATKCVLKNNEELDARVKEIIKFWSTTSKIAAKAAIEQQRAAAIANMDARFAMNCCSLSREQDRAAYLRYIFTKTLYDNEDDRGKMVGSIVMCTNKPTIGVKQLYADGMEAVPSYVFMSVDPDFQPGIGLLERSRHYFELNMAKFMRLVRSETVEFRPTLGVVSLSNKKLIQTLQDVQAHTVHCSNVIDYIKPSSFHGIAKAISGTETLHFCHSCNWSTVIFGIDVFDMPEASRLHFFCCGLQIIQSTHSLLDGFAPLGAHHFRSICTLSLARMFVESFFRYFFEGHEDDVACGCMNGNTPLKLLSPLARSVSPIFFVFAYSDTGISFGRDTYDFLSDEKN